MTGFVFQPKPEGDRYVEIHLCYKRITDGKVTTAALLSVLEYLAETSLEASCWTPGDQIPDEIRINEDCNFPRLHRLLDGMMGATAIREKLKLLEAKGFVRIGFPESYRRRCVFYNHKVVADALKNIDLTPQKVGSHLPKSGGPTPQKVTGQKTTPQKVLTDPSKSVGLTPQKVDPSNTLSNSSSNPTLSSSDRTSEESVCDASLQPAQPATQSEESTPVQKKEPDLEPGGSTTQEGGQLETVCQLQEGEFSAAASLENLKIQLNQLRDDFIPGPYSQEWRMSGAIPWKNKKNGDICSKFAAFVGKKLMFGGGRESMTPLEKGRKHIRNSELRVTGMQGLIDYWEDYQRKLSPVKIVPIAQKQEPQQTSPPPKDWAKNTLGARYRDAG